MSQPADRLYGLLPEYLRQRDFECGGALQTLLRVIQEQADNIRADIDNLNDNWFIETCQDWVVPYIGQLIGYQPVRPPSGDKRSVAENAVLFPRREVGTTIHNRRRKGTLKLLEELAMEVAEWPARAVEFGARIASNQGLDDLHLGTGRTVDLHHNRQLGDLGGPFDSFNHVSDVRSINSAVSQGRYGAFDVGLFVWRLQAFPLTNTVAYCQERAGDHCFTFSLLGNDTPLFNRPADEPRHGSSRLSLPIPITRLEFTSPVPPKEGKQPQASESYYGEGKSVAVWAGEWASCDPHKPVPAHRIIPADLADWRFRPPHGHVALDPELGRLAFPPGQLPLGDVNVSYSYGFSAAIGGGEYRRASVFPAGPVVTYCVGHNAEFREIRSACHQLHKDKPRQAVIEICDSGVYEEQLHFELEEGQRVELRAAAGARPAIYLLDWHASRPDALVISGKPKSRFTLDGVLVAGRGLQVRGDLERLLLRHTTLVPGWGLHSDSRPYRPSEASLHLVKTQATVALEHSILGPIRVTRGDEERDAASIRISDTILDATGHEMTAISSDDEGIAPLIVQVARTTVYGAMRVQAIARAENSIFTGNVFVARRQQGCMRFCYVPPGSRTPARYHCQPDQADGQAEGGKQLKKATNATRQREGEHWRVRPIFVSTRYGTPYYARLDAACAAEIRRGADDEAEMGAFHHLYEPQREDNLRTRLDEYTPAQFDAGIIYGS
ncbi:MAG TPA: hypothetical protein VIB39_10050 [Candidatus Angelobacter sp.]|jgi:hypothetical protein